MMHKSLEFNDITLKDGVGALREFVASETWQNLITLSEQRSKSVGTALSKIRLVILRL
jgi:isoleucyl-tRNA synthetase